MKNSRLLLEFSNVTVLKENNKKVLNGISVTINEGENAAILGPNGSGKSSFIKTITREFYPLERNTNFKFKLMGQDRWNLFNLRNLLGIVSNDLQYTFTRNISGEDLVLSGFFGSVGLYQQIITTEMRKKCNETLKFLEILHLSRRLINEMSSGEARRFLIARALVHDPKALILDEPTNSLDFHAQIKFHELLRKITKAGTSLILVTHNLNDIIPEISRVILFKNGQIYKDGLKKRILNSKNISELFDIKIKIKYDKGFYKLF